MLIAVQCIAEREDVGVHLALQPLFLSSAVGTSTWNDPSSCGLDMDGSPGIFHSLFFSQGARVSQGTMRHQPDRVPGNGGLVVTSE